MDAEANGEAGMTPDVRELIANELCSEGVCGGDTSSVPCGRSRGVADTILSALSAAGLVIVPEELTEADISACPLEPMPRDLKYWRAMIKTLASRKDAGT